MAFKSILVFATLAAVAFAAPGHNGRVSCGHGRKASNAVVSGSLHSESVMSSEGALSYSAVNGLMFSMTSRPTCE